MKIEKINILNNGFGHCMGKTKKQCAKETECKYNRVGRTCEKMERKSQTQPTSPPSKAISHETMPQSNSCGTRKNKKQCAKVDTCIWDPSINACSPQDAAPSNIKDIDSVTQPASQHCDGRRWHPRTVTDRTCSNSHDYPPLWDQPTYSTKYLFNSFESCCRVFYEGQCSKEDVCNPRTGI